MSDSSTNLGRFIETFVFPHVKCKLKAVVYLQIGQIFWISVHRIPSIFTLSTSKIIEA